MNDVAPMTVTCPTCGTDFPVDPERVPEGGVLAICSVCSRAFPVERPVGWVPEAAESPDRDATEFSAHDTAEPLPELDAEFEVEGEPDAGDAFAHGDELEVEEVFEVEEVTEVEEVIEVEVEEVFESEVHPAFDSVGEGEAVSELEGDPAVEPDEVEGESPAHARVDREDGADDRGATEAVQDGSDQDSAAPPPVADSTPVAGSPPVAGGSPTATSSPVAGIGRGAGSSGTVEGDATSGSARFGFRDPANRARRLARVLSSDMITYNPARYADARRNGSLREDFRDEIEKSWEEYVDQVGEEFATSTHHFTDALNEVLAQGEKLFEGPGFPY